MKTTTIAVIISVGLVGCLALLFAAAPQGSRIGHASNIALVRGPSPQSLMIESRLQAQTTTKPVSHDFLPAAIYLHPADGSGRGEFYGAGIVTVGPQGPEIITAKRSMDGDPDAEYAFEVRLLNVERSWPEYFDHQRPSIQVNLPESGRISIYVLGKSPRPFRVSNEHYDAVLPTGWGAPEVNNRTITAVRSLCSGAEYRVAGMVRGSAGAHFLVIDYDGALAAGGEGFHDAEGRLWVLTIQPMPHEVQNIQLDKIQKTGRPLRYGAALLSGPIVTARRIN
jgi:hypothetical protein